MGGGVTSVPRPTTWCGSSLTAVLLQPATSSDSLVPASDSAGQATRAGLEYVVPGAGGRPRTRTPHPQLPASAAARGRFAEATVAARRAPGRGILLAKKASKAGAQRGAEQQRKHTRRTHTVGRMHRTSTHEGHGMAKVEARAVVNYPPSRRLSSGKQGHILRGSENRNDSTHVSEIRWLDTEPAEPRCPPSSGLFPGPPTYASEPMER